MRHAGLLRKSSHALKEGVMRFTLLFLTRIKRFRILHWQSLVQLNFKEKLAILYCYNIKVGLKQLWCKCSAITNSIYTVKAMKRSWWKFAIDYMSELRWNSIRKRPRIKSRLALFTPVGSSPCSASVKTAQDPRHDRILRRRWRQGHPVSHHWYESQVHGGRYPRTPRAHPVHVHQACWSREWWPAHAELVDQ